MAKSKTAENSAPTHMTIDAEQLDKVIARMEAPELRILGAKISAGACKYKYGYRTENGAHNICTVTSDAPVHDDLSKAFSMLGPHLAVICEDVSAKAVKDIEKAIGSYPETTEKLATYSVEEISVVHNGGSVVLKGLKILSTGKSVGLTTPPISFSGDYYFQNELKISVDDVLQEVMLYHKGKISKPQLDLFDENN